MKQDQQKHNWLVDVALFGGFLGSLWLGPDRCGGASVVGVGRDGVDRVSPVEALALGGRSDRPVLRTHQPTVTHILRGGRGAGRRVCGHCGDGPGHLNLARSAADELCDLARCARGRLCRDADPVGCQDRLALALDYRCGPAERLHGPCAKRTDGLCATHAGGIPDRVGPAGLRASDGGCGRCGSAGRRQGAQQSGRRASGGVIHNPGSRNRKYAVPGRRRHAGPATATAQPTATSATRYRRQQPQATATAARRPRQPLHPTPHPAHAVCAATSSAPIRAAAASMWTATGMDGAILGNAWRKSQD